MILVVGATGRLGGMITRRLLAQGQQVRILVRPDADYEALEKAGCEPTIGDIRYPESFGPAFSGIDTVITTASAFGSDRYGTYESVDLEGNHNLVDAAQQAGVGQFIFVSTLGADMDHANSYFRAKGQTEAALRVSGMPYTILAATHFMEPWLEWFIETPLRDGKPLIVIGEGTHQHSLIAIRDVAAFATRMVGHPDAINKTIAIGGPEAFSWMEVIERIQHMVGQDLVVQHYRPGQSLPGMLDCMSQVAANFEAFDYVLDSRKTAARFGVHLTPLKLVLARRFSQPVR